MNQLPSRFRHCVMADLGCEFLPVAEYSRKIRAEYVNGRGLAVSGPVGVGKTYALAALTNFYVESGLSLDGDFEFVTAPDFFANLGLFDDHKAWDEFRETSWIRTYSRVPWLVINDLGKEYRAGKLGEQVPYQLGRVLRARSERKRVTHFTSNFNGRAIREAYGDSIESLLNEMTIPSPVIGPDRRRQT